MAGTIVVTETTSSRNIYAIIVNGSDLYWTGTGDVFEAFNSAHWGAYAVAMTESPSKTYTAAFPAAITTADTYSLRAFYRAGGSPATADLPAGWGDIGWDGTNEIIPSSGSGTNTVGTLMIGI